MYGTKRIPKNGRHGNYFKGVNSGHSVDDLAGVIINTCNPVLHDR